MKIAIRSRPQGIINQTRGIINHFLFAERERMTTNASNAMVNGRLSSISRCLNPGNGKIGKLACPPWQRASPKAVWCVDVDAPCRYLYCLCGRIDPPRL